MERYQIILAYDGTEFSGFQRQANARTVQGVVESALIQLGWKGKSLLASGRTDSGVHAEGQVAAFDLEWDHSLSDLKHALNAHLPADVVVTEISTAEADFHPRFDAISRSYRYRLFCQEDRNPLWERYAWRVWPAVDFDLIQQSACILVGRHDFAAFGTPLRSGGSTIRTVFHAGWRSEQPFYAFEISADAFLYRMVRRLVFIQVRVGQRLMDAAEILGRLEDPALSVPAGLAPSAGLALMRVGYPTIGVPGEKE